MDKSERDKNYNATMTKPYGWSMSCDEKARLEEYCKTNKVTVSGYLKLLVNEDMMRREKEPIFQRVYKRKIKDI